MNDQRTAGTGPADARKQIEDYAFAAAAGKNPFGRKVLPREFPMKLLDRSGRENTYRITNAELLSGEGSSCMCYLVSVEMSENESHRMLLKQFYPVAAADEGRVSMDGLQLTIDGFDEDADLRQMAEHFARAYDLQRQLSDLDALRSHVVTPYRRYFEGSTMYVLSQRENGDTLDRYFPRTAREFLDIAVSAAQAMAALHDNHILYMDFKPENVLWADGSRAMLFDFDAAVDMTQLDQVTQIRSTPRILAPELRDLQDFRRNKYLFLTPQADIYSFGSMLIAVLTGLWPSEEEQGMAGPAGAGSDFSEKRASVSGRRSVETGSWREGVRRILEGEFRGQTDEGEQKILLEILGRCVAEDLRVRFRTAREVLDALTALREEMFRHKKAVRRTKREVDRIVETAYVLDQYPLWQYRRKEAAFSTFDNHAASGPIVSSAGKYAASGFNAEKGNVHYVLDAGLVGDGDTAMRFFKYLLMTQIADTAVVIRWAVPDPARKMSELVHVMPQLPTAAEFILNGEEIREWEGRPVGTDPAIMTEPAAYIFLEEWDPDGDPEDLFLRWSRTEDYTLLPSWIVFADEENDSASRTKETNLFRGSHAVGESGEGTPRTNKERAIGLLEAIAANNALTPDRGTGRFCPVFVGYADADTAPGIRSAGFTAGTRERITAGIRAALQSAGDSERAGANRHDSAKGAAGGHAGSDGNGKETGILRIEDAEAENAFEHLMQWVVFASVGSAAGSGEEGRTYGKEIRERAEKIHRFYEKSRNERASARDIRKSLQRDYRYNMESSVSAALSVDAKLISAGIDPKAPNAAFQYYRRVLSGTPEADAMLKKVLYLEHRRWSVYMITAGYRVPTEEEFAEYAFNGGNDHRDSRRRLHPLIVSSDPETGIVLRDLPHKYWAGEELPHGEDPVCSRAEDNDAVCSRAEDNDADGSHAAENSEGSHNAAWNFDELDRQSLRIHRLCDRKAKRMDADFLTEELLADISKFDLRGEWVRSGEWLRAVIDRMLSGEANINVVFAAEMRAFRDRVENLDRRRLSCRQELTEDLDKIEEEMRAVIFRNRYVDYKMADEAVLRGLPLLILPPVRRIYKPLAPKLWQNVMSSILIEPEELVLITEEEVPQAQGLCGRFGTGEGSWTNGNAAAVRMAEEIGHFLREERNLSVKVSLICGTDEVRTEARSKRAILDITGMAEADAFRCARRSCFQTMPITRFANGKLEDFGYGADIPLYAQRRHLTVEETLRLFGSNPFHEENDSTMADLRPYYKKLWDAYRSVKPFHWRIFIKEMEKAEQALYIRAAGGSDAADPDKVPGGIRAADADRVTGGLHAADADRVSGGLHAAEEDKVSGSLRTVTAENVHGRMLTDTGIRRVLREWKQNGLIEPGYREPAESKRGSISFDTEYPETRGALEEMLRRAGEEPYYHEFEAVQTRREPITGRPVDSLRHYVYDRTCLVQFSFRDEQVKDLGGRKVLKSEAVRTVLEALARAGIASAPEDGGARAFSGNRMGSGDGGARAFSGNRMGSGDGGARAFSENPMIWEDRRKGECFVRFEVDDISVRKCLLKEGNVLETYVYHTIFQHVPVDDVRSNVTFTWNAKSEDASVLDGAVNNEVDIVCTKNMKTYFISCKQSMPKNEYLQEIRFFADYFGIEGTAVIVCSNHAFDEVSRKRQRPTALLARSRGMNVRFIDRSMIDEDLAGYLTAVIDGT